MDAGAAAATVVVVTDDDVVSGAGASVTGGVVAGGATMTGRTAAAASVPAPRPCERVATAARPAAATTVTKAATRPAFARPRPPPGAGGFDVSGSTGQR